MLLHCVSRWNVYIYIYIAKNDTRTFQCQGVTSYVPFKLLPLISGILQYFLLFPSEGYHSDMSNNNCIWNSKSKLAVKFSVIKTFL